eukprot:1907596-Ditylum_brightwellii.AAC.2
MDGSTYFVGPICAKNGSEIKIGVFADEFCSIVAKDVTNISNLVKAKYANEYYFPKLTYCNLEK